jgi:hypothetical protein
MTEFAPTAEQTAALDIFTRGDSMVIEAGAGTGKTSTLRLLAASTPRMGRYLAFNKAIVTDVQGTLPQTCQASTAHSLAFKALGKRYSHRLNGPRMKSWQIAQILDLRAMTMRVGTAGHKRLAEGYLAGHVMRAIEMFCQSADERPNRRHFPYIDGIDLPEENGRRTYVNNNLLAAELEPALERAWADLQRINGQLPYKHGHYLKAWQLTHPRTSAEYIMFDEAQDANPVLAAIVEEQDHAQRVYVGDANQAIYEWTGAIDAIGQMKERGLTTTPLTASFRFGPAVAAEANRWLAALDSDLRLEGRGPHSTVGELHDVDLADAILCRTNAGAQTQLLLAQKRGVAAHLVGGGSQVLSFAEGAHDLQTKGSTWHPELACFDSWGEVQAYVDQDPAGGELRLLVQLVDDFGCDTILKSLRAMPREADADLVISTAHKSKGRQWGTVLIADDFTDVDESESELRLQYVAITRATTHLDHSALNADSIDAYVAGPVARVDTPEAAPAPEVADLADFSRRRVDRAIELAAHVPEDRASAWSVFLHREDITLNRSTWGPTEATKIIEFLEGETA